MKIKLCTPEIHEELLAITEEHPELFFQNDGYEYLRLRNPEVWEAKAEQVARIEEILKEHVTGFSRFDNFLVAERGPSNGLLTLRFQYAWDHTFTGVGYLPLDHLRDGFPEKAAQA